MNDITKTKHKRYDEAFKKPAAEHWLISGKSAQQIAAKLGINVQNLPKWKQKFKALPDGQVAGTLEALQAENRRLQRELHRMVQQRDILKKPWALSPNRPAPETDKGDANRILHRSALRDVERHAQRLSRLGRSCIACSRPGQCSVKGSDLTLRLIGY